MKYTKEETQYIVEQYLTCKTNAQREECVDNLAAELNKSVHSIRSKLVAEEVYVSKQRFSKYTGTRPKSKETMVDEMEKEFGFELGQLEGLEKAPKLVLIALYEKLKNGYK